MLPPCGTMLPTCLLLTLGQRTCHRWRDWLQAQCLSAGGRGPWASEAVCGRAMVVAEVVVVAAAFSLQPGWIISVWTAVVPKGKCWRLPIALSSLFVDGRR